MRSGTKHGWSLTISGNNERNGCEIMGKIVEISGEILDNPESITPATSLFVEYFYITVYIPFPRV